MALLIILCVFFPDREYQGPYSSDVARSYEPKPIPYEGNILQFITGFPLQNTVLLQHIFPFLLLKH